VRESETQMNLLALHLGLAKARLIARSHNLSDAPNACIMALDLERITIPSPIPSILLEARLTIRNVLG